MTQWVKAFASSPADLSLIPETHRRKERSDSQKPFSDLYACTMTGIPVCTHTINKWSIFLKLTIRWGFVVASTFGWVVLVGGFVGLVAAIFTQVQHLCPQLHKEPRGHPALPLSGDSGNPRLQLVSVDQAAPDICSCKQNHSPVTF